MKTPEDIINRFIREENVKFDQERDDWMIEAMNEYSKSQNAALIKKNKTLQDVINKLTESIKDLLNVIDPRLDIIDAETIGKGKSLIWNKVVANAQKMILYQDLLDRTDDEIPDFDIGKTYASGYNVKYGGSIWVFSPVVFSRPSSFNGIEYVVVSLGIYPGTGNGWKVKKRNYEKKQ